MWGSAGGPPAGRERFLQSLLSAKGARRRPRERSSAGASGGLLPAGSGKADAVWNSTRQTATTSHNFILESRPAAAPAPAGERTGERTLGPGAAPGAASPRDLAPPPSPSPPSSQAAAAPRIPRHPRPLASPLLAARPRAPQARLFLGAQPQSPFSSATRRQGWEVSKQRRCPADDALTAVETTTPEFRTSPHYLRAKPPSSAPLPEWRPGRCVPRPGQRPPLPVQQPLQAPGSRLSARGFILEYSQVRPSPGSGGGQAQALWHPSPYLSLPERHSSRLFYSWWRLGGFGPVWECLR